MLSPLTQAPTIQQPLHNGVSRLATAVFSQALKDSGLCHTKRVEQIDIELKEEAISFLTSGNSSFRFWCQALNQNPDQVRLALCRQLTRI